MAAPDLLKIGRLVLDNGIWQSREIVPEAWIRASLQPIIETSEGPGYGYFWFCGQVPVPALGGPTRWFAGFGNGGQRLWLCPKADVAAVIYSGNYNDWSAWIPRPGSGARSFWRIYGKRSLAFERLILTPIHPQDEEARSAVSKDGPHTLNMPPILRVASRLAPQDGGRGG